MCVCGWVDVIKVTKSQQKYTPLEITRLSRRCMIFFYKSINVTPRSSTNFAVTCLICNFRLKWSKLNQQIIRTFP